MSKEEFPPLNGHSLLGALTYLL